MTIRGSCDAAHCKARGSDATFAISITVTSGAAFRGDFSTVGFAELALYVIKELGATIVDCDTGDVFQYTDDEFTALLYESKVQIAQYLATLTNTNMRTLADLIAFKYMQARTGLLRSGDL
jgi:hypothetical protein